MYHIHYLNKISEKGTSLFTPNYTQTGDMDKADKLCYNNKME